MNATVRPCTVADLERAPNCDALLAEYTAESAIPELGPTVRHADLAQYKAMEASGRITRSTDEWEMSRSCQRTMFSNAGVTYERRRRASPHMFSEATGFRLWGMALDPF